MYRVKVRHRLLDSQQVRFIKTATDIHVPCQEGNPVRHGRKPADQDELDAFRN